LSDDLGNITAKSDVGAYSYNASGPASIRPHAVSAIAPSGSGTMNTAFTYDANGNYQAKLAGPLLDRIDNSYRSAARLVADLSLPPSAEGSAEGASRVAAARAVQEERYDAFAAIWASPPAQFGSRRRTSRQGRLARRRRPPPSPRSCAAYPISP
jgi:hypothetical protein